jgi:hypothetical protein
LWSFSRFGTLYQESSGNPDLRCEKTAFHFLKSFRTFSVKKERLGTFLKWVVFSALWRRRR